MSAQGYPHLSMASFTQPLNADDKKLPESLSSSGSVSETFKMMLSSSSGYYSISL